jgi:hypothetical protein
MTKGFIRKIYILMQILSRVGGTEESHDNPYSGSVISRLRVEDTERYRYDNLLVISLLIFLQRDLCVECSSKNIWNETSTVS